MLFLIPLVGPILGALLIPTALNFLIGGRPGVGFIYAFPYAILGILSFGLIF
jgi:hypothetical protein